MNSLCFKCVIQFQSEEDCLPNDPFNGLKEETSSFIDKIPTIIAEDVSSEENHDTKDMEETNLQQVSNENIVHEKLNDGIEFECVSNFTSSNHILIDF